MWSERTWSIAALAADAADERPRASMMAAPRLPTVGRNSPSSQASSPITSRAGLPPMRALVKSANIVGEWLPKMMMSSTSVIGTPAFWASWVRARFWSRRVIAVKRSGPSRDAWAAAIMQFVLQGLPTTTTRASSEATSSMAVPCSTKILPLSVSSSARSMPGPRGLLPMRMHQSASAKASRGSSVSTMSARSGNAQSSSSMATPRRAFWGPSAGISSSCRTTGWSAPNASPAAIRGRME